MERYIVELSIASPSRFNYLKDYKDAIAGIGPLDYEWEDKPHRLVYDLVNYARKIIKRSYPKKSIVLSAGMARQDMISVGLVPIYKENKNA